VKAVIYGHLHHWNVQQKDDIHLIGLPPVACVFVPNDPSGWVSMKLYCADKSLSPSFVVAAFRRR
jgi:hypothetical protein